MLAGPYDAGLPGRKLWKLQSAGLTDVKLTVRTASLENPPFVFCEARAVQAVRYNASTEEETTDAHVAYARFKHREPTRYRDGWLP